MGLIENIRQMISSSMGGPIIGPGQPGLGIQGLQDSRKDYALTGEIARELFPYVFQSAGIYVTPGNALTFSAVWAAVRILAETVASIPLILYERRQDGGRDRAINHPLYYLLHDQFNDEMTSYTARETIMAHLATWGNSYNQLIYTAGGQLQEIIPQPPDEMMVERDPDTRQLVYKLRNTPIQNVLHIPGLSMDGIVGLSPIQYHRKAVGLGIAAQAYGAGIFENGAKPGGVLEHPAQLSGKARENLRQSWNEMHQGPGNSGRIAILEEGMTFKGITIPPEDAQFLQTRKFQVGEIARIFRIPPHMLADLDRATFSNIEQQSLEFVVYSIMPWLKRIEQILSKELLTPAERKVYFIEFLVDGLLRGDIKTRFEAYGIARQNGWMSANEIRIRENMNPVPGGDDYLIPLNMISISEAGSIDGSQARDLLKVINRSTPERQQLDHQVDPDPQLENRASVAIRYRHKLMGTYQPLITDAAARILRREKNDVGSQAKKMLNDESALVQEFLAWLDDFYNQHSEFITRQLGPTFRSYSDMVALAASEETGASGYDQALDDFLESYMAAYAFRHSARSLDQLKEIIGQALQALDDPLDPVLKTLESWPDERAGQIGMEESNRLNNAAARTIYLAAGVQYIKSVAFGDSCPYCRALDGKVVGIQHPILDVGDFQPDGAERPLNISKPVKHGPYHRGCDCLTVAEM